MMANDQRSHKVGSMAAFCIHMAHTSNPSTLYVEAGQDFKTKYWLKTKHAGTHSGQRNHVYIIVCSWSNEQFSAQPFLIIHQSPIPSLYLGKEKREMPTQTSPYSVFFPSGFLNSSKSNLWSRLRKIPETYFQKNTQDLEILLFKLS